VLNVKQETALFAAARTDAAACVQYLLDAEADPNRKVVPSL
jgi:hypothetical protein